MAKIKIPGKRSKRWRGYRTMRAGKKVATHVRIYRTSQVGSTSNFMGCVAVGTGRTTPGHPSTLRYDPKGAWQACASGKNPRLAVGRAFAKLGRALAHRSGAFNGLK